MYFFCWLVCSCKEEHTVVNWRRIIVCKSRTSQMGFVAYILFKAGRCFISSNSNYPLEYEYALNRSFLSRWQWQSTVQWMSQGKQYKAIHKWSPKYLLASSLFKKIYNVLGVWAPIARLPWICFWNPWKFGPSWSDHLNQGSAGLKSQTYLHVNVPCIQPNSYTKRNQTFMVRWTYSTDGSKPEKLWLPPQMAT